MAAQQQQNDDGEAEEVTSSTSSPSVDSTTTTTTTNDDDDDDAFPTMGVMESVVRCTLAGLGGSIVGLSQQKRLESMRVVAGAAATAAARRRRSPSSGMLQQNLPLTWAISCMAFCSIIETCRWTSPSTIIWNALIQPHNKETNDDDALSSNSNQASSLSLASAAAGTTVADFTIGGAIAGVAGAVGRRTQLQQRLPSAMLRGSTTYFGIVPGIALGFAFGILQATTDYGLDYAEQQRATKIEMENGN